MANKDEFLSDPRNKLGDCDWEADIDDFARALTSGAPVRPDGVARVADASGEIELTTDDLLKLRALFANYR